MTGTELFAASRTHAPDAKLLLLTAYADTDVAIAGDQRHRPGLLPAQALGSARPSGSTRSSTTCSDDWQAAHPEQTSDLRVVGNRWSERAHELKMFLTRNHVPYRWYDVERDEEGERLRGLADAGPVDLPLVLVPSGQHAALPRPWSTWPMRSVCTPPRGSRSTTSASSAAVRPAWRPPCTRPRRGCRPSWSSARHPVVRPGQSAAIENYLGFPRGLSGADLAQRAIAQVSRFGAEMVLARSVTGLQVRGPVRAVLLGERRRDRGPVGGRGQRGVVPAAGGTGHRGPGGSWHLLRRDGGRVGPDRGRRGVPDRRGQLGRPGGAELRPTRDDG